MGDSLARDGRRRRDAVGAVLLAAGRGSRLGDRPKCLLEREGEPLVRRLLAALTDAGVGEVVVVTGHHAAAVEPVLRSLPVTLVRNPDPDAGQVSSQRLGLAALSGQPAAVIVALADQPLIDAQDIIALVEAWHTRPEGAECLYPEVDGARGNPVIFSAAVRAQILAAGADVGGRQWQAAHPDRVARLVTGNRHYCIDVDTPEDLARVEREIGLRLGWPTSMAAKGGSTA